MFYKNDWYESIKQLVVIEGKNKESISVKDFIPYWLSLMEMEGTDKLFCGFKAHDAFVSLLKDDEYFKNTNYESLLRAYQIIRGFGGGLPECRVYTGGAIAHHFIGCFKTDIPDSFYHFKKVVDRNFHDTHSQCWKVWKITGDGIDFKEETVDSFRTTEVRRQVLEIIEIIRQNDVDVFEALKNCLN